MNIRYSTAVIYKLLILIFLVLYLALGYYLQLVLARDTQARDQYNAERKAIQEHHAVEVIP